MDSNLYLIDSAPETSHPLERASLVGRLHCIPRIGWILLSVVLLNFAYAPFHQFYLAYIALTPLLIAFSGIRSAGGAFAWGWLAGILHFTATLTWMWHTTIAGTIALLLYLGLFWAAFAVVVVKMRWLEVASSSVTGALLKTALVSSAWTAQEWVREWLFTGFGWTPIGQTQSPFLHLCQIAEFSGIHGVSFILMLVNAAIFIWIAGTRWPVRIAASAVAAGIVLACCLYGGVILADPMPPNGPRIMLVQPNFPHERGGARTVTQQQQIDYHFPETERALGREKVDLVVWSETVMPPMNAEVRTKAKDAAFLQKIHADLLELVRRHRVSLVFGAYAVPTLGGTSANPTIHNSTYLYSHDRSDQPRYDKIHLVPFGEIVPFRDSIPWLYRLFMRFAAYSVDYTIDPGPQDQMTIFRVGADSGQWNFVTPICFEDIDGALIAAMLRGDSGKRADFIVNITNDGWFNDRQKSQEFQSAIFRCIENRVPMARCSNTGISGFVDPAGRIRAILPLNAEGVLTQRLAMSPKVTVYTRHGDLFAILCSSMVAVPIVFRIVRTIRVRKPTVS